MIELKLNKESELTFNINIEGSENPPKAKLVFGLNENMELGIKGTFKDEGHLTVSVPSLLDLKERFNDEKVRGYLEVVVEDSYHIPWEDDFNLKTPVTVKAEESTVKKEDPKKEIKISINSIKEKEKKTEYTFQEQFLVPKTKMLFEKGDKIEIVDAKATGENVYSLKEGFILPGTDIQVSRQSKIRIIS